MRSLTHHSGLAALAFWLIAARAPSDPTILEGITFAGDLAVYAPARELGQALSIPVEWDADAREVRLGPMRIPAMDTRRLIGGERLLPNSPRTFGTEPTTFAEDIHGLRVEKGDQTLLVRRGDKRVELDLSLQQLQAWQGARLVLSSHISSGKAGHGTPAGRFRAQNKERMHYSRLYGNAPMPWSIQVSGNIFIHGFSTVPDRPASHGCIRVPVTGNDPARWLFGWIDIGTPITIFRGRKHAARG